MSDSKRKKFKTILAKLQKLLPHLGNENASEAETARQTINRLLTTAGLDWQDLISLMQMQEENGPSILDMFAKLFAKDKDTLVQLGLAGATLFHSASATFADVMIDGHRNTWLLGGEEFSDWLLHQFFKETKKAPGGTAMKEAIRTLSAHAKFKGEQHEVHLRVARFGGAIYLDIGDPEWNVVEIDQTGWRIIQDSPVRFRRVQGMQALPIPERGGSITQLRPLVNLSDDGFTLYVSCILDALYPGRPHPVLYLAGEEGSAKSTAAKIARGLVDPNEVALRTLPSTVRDIFVSAHGSHTLVFDNVSNIPPVISDALCQLTTGSGFGTRRLYTDLSQVLIGGYRPVIINGLQNAIDRSDLADRAVVIPMQRVAAEHRLSETEIWSRFERDRAQIFGALLDCMVAGLRKLPHTRLSRLPRMADYVLWAVASSPFADGAFIKAFEGSATEATDAVAENDPVVVAVAAFMMERNSWSGTAAELHYELSTHDRTEAAPSKWKTWPRDVRSFGKQLRAAASVLRKIGVEVEFGKALDRQRTRTITLRKIEATERPHIVPDVADIADIADVDSRTAPGSAGRTRGPRLLK
jgi:hypothetical protein